MPDGVSTIALGQEEALDRDAAECREVDDIGVLDAISEAAARGDEGIGERQLANLEGEIHQCPATASQTTRCASKTGPSIHERVWCGAPPPAPPVPSSVEGRARTTQL